MGEFIMAKDKMEAVVKAEGCEGGTEFREVPIPEPGYNDVLIKNKISSICGTDVHIWNWDNWAANRIKPPLIYGHEFAGEVVEIGKGVKSVKVGDYVSGECHIACYTCYNCRNGMEHICENVKIFGVDQDGIFAEYASIPEFNVWKNDPDLPMELATIQDPFGNAVHTAFKSDIPGKNVAILGCGPIGLMCVTLCKALSAAQIFAVGRRNEYRIDLAKKLGANKVFKAGDDVEGEIRAATEGRGVDVVLEMSGNAKAVEQGLKLLRAGGDIQLLGVYADNANIDLSDGMVFKYTNMQGINGRLMYQTWYRMQGLMKSGNLDLETVITHKFKFKEFMKAMDTMRGGNSGKVVMYHE
jgi:threonine 3-dehydrogenase